MNEYRLIVIALLTVLATGCAGTEPGAPAGSQEMPAAQAPQAGEGPAVGSRAFLRHMHEHARQLKRLNDALEAGDLDGARLPAFWLSRHQGMHGPYEAWQPHLKTMRDAADEVEKAPNLAVARAASQRIAEGCDGCHMAAGVEIASLFSRRH